MLLFFYYGQPKIERAKHRMNHTFYTILYIWNDLYISIILIFIFVMGNFSLENRSNVRNFKIVTNSCIVLYLCKLWEVVVKRFNNLSVILPVQCLAIV